MPPRSRIAQPTPVLPEGKLRRIRESEQRLRSELRAVSQRRRRALSSEGADLHRPSPVLSALLLLVHFLSGYQSEAAAAYWARERRAQCRPPLPVEVLERRIEELFLDCNLDDLVELAYDFIL